MGNVWFTSDLHLGHENISKFENRYRKPTKEEDAEFILDAIFSTVKKRDTLWILGDIAFRDFGKEKLLEISDKIGWHTNIVLGNHDHYEPSVYSGFHRIFGAQKKYGFWITHIPIEAGGMRYAKGNVHGHIHVPSQNLGYPYFNVNWDIHGSLINLDTIREYLQ
jgi:calcineurin-like phosphoesterase family protein